MIKKWIVILSFSSSLFSVLATEVKTDFDGVPWLKGSVTSTSSVSPVLPLSVSYTTWDSKGPLGKWVWVEKVQFKLKICVHYSEKTKIFLEKDKNWDEKIQFELECQMRPKLSIANTLEKLVSLSLSTVLLVNFSVSLYIRKLLYRISTLAQEELLRHFLAFILLGWFDIFPYS